MSAAFVALVFLPVAVLALQRGKPAENLAENRKAADFPAAPRNAFEWASWPRAFEAWHGDHLGLRTSMLRAHSLLLVFGFDADPSPRLMLGRERWIYNPGAGIDFWRGAKPLAASELAAWSSGLESRRLELEKRGIVYRFVMAPSKSEIYPDHLPRRYHKGGPSRLDQVAAHFAAAATGTFLDLRPALQDERTRDVGDDCAFFALGIHWTERGALAGTRAIVRELARERPRIATVDDTLEGTRLIDDPGDTLAAQMYLGSILTQRFHQVRLAPSAVRDLRIEELASPRQVTVDQDDASLPRAVIFHDSFGMALVPLLGRHFSHAVFRWQPDIDLDLIEREHPDIVLQVVSDGVLSLPPPAELHLDTRGRVREQFAASADEVLRVDAATNSPRIAPTAGGRVFVRGTGTEARVVCASDDSADTFLLPAFQLREGTRPIVRIVFESSVASSASLFFQTRADSTYSRRRQLQAETHIGGNELYFELLEPSLAGRLRFRPAQEVGTFAIQALEVRLVAD